MKILYLSTWFPYPPDNGYKIRIYYLLRALSERHEITLLSYAFNTTPPDQTGALDFVKSYQTIELNPYELNKAGPLRTFLSLRPMASRPIPEMSELVTELALTTEFDAVVASTEVMMDYALRIPNTVRILEEHNSFTRWMKNRYERQERLANKVRCWISWQKQRWFEARHYSDFDLVTMVSEEDRQTTLETALDKSLRVEVVPNGVDCERNRPGLATPRPNSLVYNGSLTYSANYDAMHYFLAEVYPYIQRKAPNVTLSITGTTKNVDVTNLQLDDSVKLTGYVPDIRPVVAQHAACVVPLLEGGGTRLKILEAMALGTPVVSTSKGAEGLAATPGEHLLIADDPVDFAEKTLRLLRDERLRGTLIRNARRLVENRYNWDQLGEYFADLVEETVQHRYLARKAI